jgi:ferritin-like metal-binding protein YciE
MRGRAWRLPRILPQGERLVFTSLEALFQSQLQDALSAETQLVQALPKMANAARSAELREGFQEHLAETIIQVERLNQVCQMIGCSAGSQLCEAMEGLITEGEEIIESEMEDSVRDAGLIIAAQKIEHYEIALYGGLCSLAKELGQVDSAEILHLSLEEEKGADEKLTQLAESRINREAAAV